MKKIKNIVFYETYVNGKVEKRACFFLMNGYVEDVSYGEAINACFKICKERNITSKKEFANMINKDTIHVVSEKKLLNNLNYYSQTIDEIKEAVNESVEGGDELTLPGLGVFMSLFFSGRRHHRSL